MKRSRPRVRREGSEVELETHRQLQREDLLNERALEQMLVGASTRKYARSLEPAPAGLEEMGISKSAVSRRLESHAQVGKLAIALRARDAQFDAANVGRTG